VNRGEHAVRLTVTQPAACIECTHVSADRRSDLSPFVCTRRILRVAIQLVVWVSTKEAAVSIPFVRNLGIHVYGLASIALGIIGFVWADFALVWQPVPDGIPGRTALAYATAAVLVAGGAAINVRRTAAIGAAALAILYALDVVLLHVPIAAVHPLVVGSWSGIAEQLLLALGATVAYASTASIDASRADRIRRVARIAYGVCLLLFAAAHFRYPAETAALVPQWLPPSQMFWVYFVGASFLAAALAVLSGIQAGVASALVAAMLMAFAALVHLPLVLKDPSHLSWTMNAMNLSLAGAAWIIADSYASPRAAAP
jgi:hypothetical protein